MADNRSTGWVKWGNGWVRICRANHICNPNKPIKKRFRPKPCPFCLWQPDERFIQLPRNWVEHTSVGDCVLKGMAFPIEQWNSRAHYSDCAVHNDPAYNNGECTCGRPQQSAEPVAYRVAREPFQVEKDGEPFAYSTKYMNGMWQPLFAASPGPSVAELEKLEMDLRAEAHKLVPMEYASRGLYEKFYRMDTEAAGLVESADRLSAVIRGTKT